MATHTVYAQWNRKQTFLQVPCPNCSKKMSPRPKDIGGRVRRTCQGCRTLFDIDIPVTWMNHDEVTLTTLTGSDPGNATQAVQREPRSVVNVDSAAVEVLQALVATLGDSMTALMRDQVKLNDELATLKQGEPVTITFAVPNKPAKKAKKVNTADRHIAYRRTMDKIAAMKKAFLVGPAGTGKSTLASQIAEDLGLEYGFLSCTEGLSEAHVLGRMNAQGKYIPSDFIRIFEGGGLFLFDEGDAMDANMALVVNEALSNGRVSVPNRPSKPIAVAHPDFVCLVATNTYGTGNSVEYSGRNAMDAAFLDRFVGLYVKVDYDIERERGIAKSYKFDELAEVLWKIRQNVMDARIRKPVSTRAFIHLGTQHAMQPDVYTLKECVNEFFMGWTDAEREKAMLGVNVDAVAVAVDPAAEPNKPAMHDPNSPACPQCGGRMIKRMARKGKRAGKSFWGCVNFGKDKCMGTININEVA